VFLEVGDEAGDIYRHFAGSLLETDANQ